MKTSAKIGIAILLIVGLKTTACNSGSTNNDNKSIPEQSIKTDIPEQEKEVASAGKDKYSGFQKFVNESNIKIDKNAKNISDLKHHSPIVEEIEKNEYLVEVDNLEESNDILKAELDDYVRDGNGNWMIFKAGFDQNLDDLDLALNEVSNNVK